MPRTENQESEVRVSRVHMTVTYLSLLDLLAVTTETTDAKYLNSQHTDLGKYISHCSFS